MIIINEELCDEGKLHFDDGFSFGKGLFETILIKNGVPIFLEEHLERLNLGLKKLGVNRYLSWEYVLENIDKFQCKNCGIKIIVSDKNIIFTKRSLNYSEEQYHKGFSLRTSDVRRNKSSMLTYLKSINYMDNILEREKILNQGYDEALFLNDENIICEGSISNVFFVKNNKIYTPGVQCGLLNGIIRSWVCNRYKAIEGEYIVEELYNSDGVFITNSLMGIMSVSKINSYEVAKLDIIESIRDDYNTALKK